MPFFEILNPSFEVMYPNSHVSVLRISSEGGLGIAQNCPKLEILRLYVLSLLTKFVNAPQQPVRISNIDRGFLIVFTHSSTGPYAGSVLVVILLHLAK
jgi:hypothetical protein